MHFDSDAVQGAYSAHWCGILAGLWPHNHSLWQFLLNPGVSSNHAELSIKMLVGGSKEVQHATPYGADYAHVLLLPVPCLRASNANQHPSSTHKCRGTYNGS